MQLGKRSLRLMALVMTGLLAAAPAIGADPKPDPRDDKSPWAIASGAEWSGEYPKFNPMLKDAGVRWLRLFPEWQGIQPARGEWNWEGADKIVANARENNIKISGIFCFLSKFASADGGTRKFPIKDIQMWRDYVNGCVTRYNNDIKYWEIYNEFNGSFGPGGTPKIYAELVREASDTAKKVDPSMKIGMSVANFDLNFLDQAIKAGAADHFDFVCVHPYENLGAVMQDGGEPGYLSLAGSLRKMLADNKQKADMPLWITETGHQAPNKPDAKKDAEQAEALVKVYVLSVAQGFEKVFWFEARGPSYGKGTDHGFIRADWSPRPAYDAMKVMTGLLGAEPAYLGWHKAGDDGYGFAFQGNKTSVLVAWSPPKSDKNKLKFDAAVRVITLDGKESALAAGEEYTLTRTPVFVADIPARFVEQVKGNAGKAFPWGTDYSKAREVSIRLGALNQDKGIKQTKQETTSVVNGLDNSWRKFNFGFGGEGRYIYFRVEPTFVPFGTKDLEITVVARRSDPKKKASMGIVLETTKGYRSPGKNFDVPEEDAWHEYTWKIDNANFVGQWGWNFRFEATGSADQIAVKEVRIKKP